MSIFDISYVIPLIYCHKQFPTPTWVIHVPLMAFKPEPNMSSFPFHVDCQHREFQVM